jgi:hypothetical protein
MPKSENTESTQASIEERLKKANEITTAALTVISFQAECIATLERQVRDLQIANCQ